MAQEYRNNGLMPAYFKNHEIQRSYNFLVSFLNYAPGFLINEFQIKSVSLPNFAFKKEVQKIGGVFPQIFPVLDSDGLELKMEFEEDNTGKVSRMILDMQNRVIDRHGYYQYPDKAKLGDIAIRVVDNAGDDVVTYTAKNCFYLKNEEVKYSYSEQTAISYNVTFAFDFYEFVYHKQQKKFGNNYEAINEPDRLKDI